jgi:hypothetical protein
MSGKARNRYLGDDWRKERSQKRFESATVRNRRKSRFTTLFDGFTSFNGIVTSKRFRYRREGQRPL